MVLGIMLSEERIPVKKRKSRFDNVSPMPEEGDLVIDIDEVPKRSPSPEPLTSHNHTSYASDSNRRPRSTSPKSNSSRNERRSLSPKSPTGNNGAGWNRGDRNRNAEKAHRARENTKYCMGMVRGHLQEMKESMQTSMDQLLQHLPMRTDMTVLNLIEKFRDSRRGEVVTDALIQSRSSAATILSLSTQTTDMFRWYVGLVSEVLKGVEETKGKLSDLEKRVAEDCQDSLMGRSGFYKRCGHGRQSTTRVTPVPPYCDCGVEDQTSLKNSALKTLFATNNVEDTRDRDSTPEHGYRWFATNSDRATGNIKNVDAHFSASRTSPTTGFLSGFRGYRSNDAEVTEMDIKGRNGRPGLVGGALYEPSEPMAKRLKTEEPVVEKKSMELTDLVANFVEYQARLKHVFDSAVSRIPVDSNSLRI